MKTASFFLLIVLLLSFIGCSQEDDTTITYEQEYNTILYTIPLISTDSVNVSKIWSNDKHCSFTSLVKYHEQYYCAFREGIGHVGDNGNIRIIVSSNGREWKDRFLLSLPGFDLRDPNLSVMPDGRLMLICGRQIPYTQTQTVVAFLDNENGKFTSFTELLFSQDIMEPSNWLWRATWFDDVCYGVRYGNYYTNVVKSKDGIHWSTVSNIGEGAATEVELQRMSDGRMVALMRYDNGYGCVCYSSYPFEKWERKRTNLILQGQCFVVSSNDKIVCVSRNVQEGQAKTTVFCNVTDYSFAKLFDLPSGQDTGYGDILVEDDRVLISYYSQHSGRRDIYIAEIPKKCFTDREIFF